MNINFDTYYIFYVVAKNESISKGANELFISQPAVTQTIQKLESQLGGTLFVRTKHGVTLTEEGKVFYNYIKQGVELFKNAENKFTELKNLESGSIKIGCSTAVTRHILLPYLEHFHKLYPKIDIEITNQLTRELFQLLRNGIVDMLVLNSPVKENKDMDIIPFKEVQDCFITSQNYINLANEPIDINELKNYPLIFQKKPSSTRGFLDDFLEKNNILLNPKIEVASYGLVEEFTRAGFGVGYSTKEYLTKPFKEKSLFEIKTIQSIPKRTIGIAFMKNVVPSFGVQKLLSLMMDSTLTPSPEIRRE